jgi:hypothetical protein
MQFWSDRNMHQGNIKHRLNSVSNSGVAAHRDLLREAADYIEKLETIRNRWVDGYPFNDDVTEDVALKEATA